MAANKEVIELNGTIVETLPGTQFKVELENGHKMTDITVDVHGNLLHGAKVTHVQTIED